MAQEVTLGGDRIGSGQKQTVELHNYGMNSFNLEQDWKSSMAPGILYPCLKLIGTNHGTFDIDIDAFVRTLPTKGPLFGSFKLQVDVYAVAIRLYQGILHNNPTDIGLNMDKVFLPKIELKCSDHEGAARAEGSNDYNFQINESSLEKYLGLSGWGRNERHTSSTGYLDVRKLQCVPELAYYDIFKCYYSNKQEENAYVITPGTPTATKYIERVIQYPEQPEEINLNPYNDENLTIYKTINWSRNIVIIINKQNYTTEQLLSKIGIAKSESLQDSFWFNDDTYFGTTTSDIPGNKLQIDVFIKELIFNESEEDTLTIKIIKDENLESKYYTADIKLQEFALKNIDDMRYALLSNNQLNSQFELKSALSKGAGYWCQLDGTDETGLPYSALFKTTEQGISWNAFKQNGLVVKTYQSDLFNNWLSTDFVDTITAMTTVDTTSGGFTMDTLNLMEKFYQLLNRIVVGGGTYEDWQEAVYGEGAVRKAETPMYIGGMSAEIMFEEVVSTAETNVKNDLQALGSLGGKGTMLGKKGGNSIHCKCEEPSYIMAIVSLTPRICYSQGNDWDRTELDTLDDLHKPALDGIGFQDLIVEQFAWWDTVLKYTDGYGVKKRHAAGKQTAWINYQTAIDKCYGDFAMQDGYSFMVLNRNYEIGENSTVKDITTYIDPAKYNYAFAYTSLDSQNFWVQLHFKITARRKMGAQQIPNL